MDTWLVDAQVNTQHTTLVCPESSPVAHGIASEREDANLGTPFKTSFNPQNCPTSHRGLQNEPIVLPCQTAHTSLYELHPVHHHHHQQRQHISVSVDKRRIHRSTSTADRLYEQMMRHANTASTEDKLEHHAKQKF